MQSLTTSFLCTPRIVGLKRFGTRRILPPIGISAQMFSVNLLLIHKINSRLGTKVPMNRHTPPSNIGTDMGPRKFARRSRPSPRSRPPKFRDGAALPSRAFLDAMRVAMVTATESHLVEGPFPSKSNPLYRLEFRTLPSKRKTQVMKHTGEMAIKWNARLHIRPVDGRMGRQRLTVRGFESFLPFHPCELKNKCDIYKFIEFVEEAYHGLSILGDVCLETSENKAVGVSSCS